MNTLIIYIRASNHDVAQAIVTELLEQQLILNAQLIASEAEWEEHVTLMHEEELLLICRTEAKKESDIRSTLARLYPYQTPLIASGGVYVRKYL